MKYNKKAFSLVEMLVTLAIFAILSVILLNSLLLNIKLSTKINIRAKVRSNINEVYTQIERDIRNADEVDINNCTGAYCRVKLNSVWYVWEINENTGSILRTNESYNTINFKSSQNIYFNKLSFNVLNSAEESGEYKFANVLVYFEAESNSSVLGCEVPSNNSCENNSSAIQWVDDQVRQFSVSIRNYYIN